MQAFKLISKFTLATFIMSKIWERENESRYDRHEGSNTYLLSLPPSLCLSARAYKRACVHVYVYEHFMWVHMCMNVHKGQKSFSVILYLTCWDIFPWTRSSLIQLDLLPSKPQGFSRFHFSSAGIICTVPHQTFYMNVGHLNSRSHACTADT